MADRHAQVPGGSYVNDLAEFALYQRQVPGDMMVNETQLIEAGGGDTVRWIVAMRVPLS
jgi:hypothetical protein